MAALKKSQMLKENAYLSNVALWLLLKRDPTVNIISAECSIFWGTAIPQNISELLIMMKGLVSEIICFVSQIIIAWVGLHNGNCQSVIEEILKLLCEYRQNLIKTSKGTQVFVSSLLYVMGLFYCKVTICKLTEKELLQVGLYDLSEIFQNSYFVEIALANGCFFKNYFWKLDWIRTLTRSTLFQKRLLHRCLSVNFAVFFFKSSLQNTSWWRFLKKQIFNLGTFSSGFNFFNCSSARKVYPKFFKRFPY